MTERDRKKHWFSIFSCGCNQIKSFHVCGCKDSAFFHAGRQNRSFFLIRLFCIQFACEVGLLFLLIGRGHHWGDVITICDDMLLILSISTHSSFDSLNIKKWKKIVTTDDTSAPIRHLGFQHHQKSRHAAGIFYRKRCVLITFQTGCLNDDLPYFDDIRIRQKLEQAYCQNPLLVEHWWIVSRHDKYLFEGIVD